MIFSSTLFLYLFLPLTLLGYYLAPRAFRNYWLLLASLIFFAWGGVSYTVILIGSIVANYLLGLLIERSLPGRLSWYWLCAGVSLNLGLLAVFKYANFFTGLLGDLCSALQLPPVQQSSILLPIGISFYTFHSISYLVDIYRGKSGAQHNILNLALYISMFSQLVAGPIVRYSDVWQQLTQREHSWLKFGNGVERFLIGLAKKVLIANTLGKVADDLFARPPEELGALNAWLGLVCYTLQIYCDFAGYSDMAIGLGKLFGFTFLENFNYPYLSRSVKEFWRRWHISLSSFFRDYVYIPLGGNRVSTRRQYINLITVFFLTGFWHGAGWNFIVWGLFHGFFLLLERLWLGRRLERLWSPLAMLYTFLVVAFAWVLFRADTLAHAVAYWKALFDASLSYKQLSLFISFINDELLIVLTFAVLGSFGAFRKLDGYLQRLLISPGLPAKAISYGYHAGSLLVYGLILLLCTLYLVAGSYNPFIYYRF